MVLTPKSIEAQWVRRVDGHDIAKQIILPSGPPPEEFRVAICEDGKQAGCTSQVSVREHLENLFVHWNVRTKVVVDAFSFVGSNTKSDEVLLNCHMFYFGGIYDGCLTHAFRYAMRNSSLVQSSVQRNRICGCWRRSLHLGLYSALGHTGS